MDAEFKRFAAAQLEMIRIATQMAELQRELFSLPMSRRAQRQELEQVYQTLREEEERLIEMTTEIQVRRLEASLSRREVA